MNWQDEGYLISKTKFRENANIVNVFTKTFGKVSGIIYGATSRKIRNYLQISNKIYLFYSSKNENKLGYFKTELINAISPKYFNDKKKISALLSLSSLLNVLLPESQPYKKIYNSLENLIINLNQENWILLYIYWELNLIKELGFDPNLEKFKDSIKNEADVVTLDIDSIKYQVPKYLISKNEIKTLNPSTIIYGLSFTRSIMLNKFFLPNNLIFPKSRIHLEKYFS